jgi:tRNA (guanine37-N1)-methyltransferase
MWVGVVSLFPEMLGAVTRHGVVARAIADGILAVEVENPREFALDRHRTVDDRPYGGGPGMVMKVEPLLGAIAALRARAPTRARTVYLSPQGRVLDQARVEALAREPALVLVAGRYEGVDERVLRQAIDEEVSLGDFVLTGGELPAMVLIDAVARFLPGTLGNAESILAESHRGGLLDCPHYTRPEQVLGLEVPAELLSGDHEATRRWRLMMALGRTFERRPELLARRSLSAEERQLLQAYLTEQGPERVQATEHAESNDA